MKPVTEEQAKQTGGALIKAGNKAKVANRYFISLARPIPGTVGIPEIAINLLYKSAMGDRVIRGPLHKEDVETLIGSPQEALKHMVDVP